MIMIDLGNVILGFCIAFAVMKAVNVLTRLMTGDTITPEQSAYRSFVISDYDRETEIEQSYVPGYPDEQSEIADVINVSGRAAEDNLLGEALR